MGGSVTKYSCNDYIFITSISLDCPIIPLMDSHASHISHGSSTFLFT